MFFMFAQYKHKQDLNKYMQSNFLASSLFTHLTPGFYSLKEFF